VLRFERVTRVYRDTPGAAPKRALDDVSFTLERGSRTALVGPNGAGKTTLLRIAATLDAPTSGSVRLDGASDAPAARRRLAYLAQEPGLYDALTVRENLAFVARFYGRGSDVPRAAAALAVPLDARAASLSRGERQRAAIARALLAGDILLLDEPTTALDDEGRARALAALDEAPATLLVATHDDELVKRCDRVLRLDGGRLA
jgi:ABC-type multidrug transport system ATPase subunit